MVLPTNIDLQTIQKPVFGANFWLRAAAQIIDLVVHNIVTFIVGIVIGVLLGLYAVATGVSPASLSAKLQSITILNYIFPLFGYAVYHTICEGLHGATLGKLILKIHVVKDDGNPCPVGPAFIRSIAFFLDALFFGVVAAVSMRSSDLRQRYGDKWARTVVVERSQLSQFPWPSAWKFIAVFSGAVVADGFIYAILLFMKLLF